VLVICILRPLVLPRLSDTPPMRSLVVLGASEPAYDPSRRAADNQYSHAPRARSLPRGRMCRSAANLLGPEMQSVSDPSVRRGPDAEAEPVTDTAVLPILDFCT